MIDERIDEYLGRLKHALAGSDPALIQDATYDAEEHLRSELAETREEELDEAFASVIERYGSPEEVAAAYVRMERNVQTALATPAPVRHKSVVGRFFGVLTDSSAWLSILYMLLALATGIAYFTVAVTGLSMTAGFMILIIGMPFALLFLGVVRRTHGATVATWVLFAGLVWWLVFVAYTWATVIAPEVAHA